MKKTTTKANYKVTKADLIFLNKYFNKITRYFKAKANEILKEYQTPGEHLNGLNPREFLKHFEVKTRALKKDNSNYKEIFINHYITKAETIKNDILSLLNDETIETFKACEVVTEWRKNNVWGWNPCARVWVNNHFAGEDSASGCGYDKQSRAINGAIYNNNIWRKSVIIQAVKTLRRGEALPYGVRADNYGIVASFGGCGVSTFTNILKWLGAQNVKVSGRDNESIFTY